MTITRFKRAVFSMAPAFSTIVSVDCTVRLTNWAILVVAAQWSRARMLYQETGTPSMMADEPWDKGNFRVWKVVH